MLRFAVLSGTFEHNNVAIETFYQQGHLIFANVELCIFCPKKNQTLETFKPNFVAMVTTNKDTRCLQSQVLIFLSKKRKRVSRWQRMMQKLSLDCYSHGLFISYQQQQHEPTKVIVCSKTRYCVMFPIVCNVLSSLPDANVSTRWSLTNTNQKRISWFMFFDFYFFRYGNNVWCAMKVPVILCNVGVWIIEDIV